jgi:hypothetical protein
LAARISAQCCSWSCTNLALPRSSHFGNIAPRGGAPAARAHIRVSSRNAPTPPAEEAGKALRDDANPPAGRRDLQSNGSERT